MTSFGEGAEKAGSALQGCGCAIICALFLIGFIVVLVLIFTSN